MVHYAIGSIEDIETLRLHTYLCRITTTQVYESVIKNFKEHRQCCLVGGVQHVNQIKQAVQIEFPFILPME